MSNKKNTYNQFDESNLLKSLQESRRKLLALRFQKQTGELMNYRVIKQTRSDIARILTEISSRKKVKSL